MATDKFYIVTGGDYKGWVFEHNTRCRVLEGRAGDEIDGQNILYNDLADDYWKVDKDLLVEIDMDDYIMMNRLTYLSNRFNGDDVSILYLAEKLILENAKNPLY